MIIGVCGDTHGDLNFKNIYKAKKLGADTLLVCGDFGYIWDGSLKEQKQLNYLNKIGVQVLFCDGNHENFDVLNSYPISEMYGGRVHKIRDNIIHLMRGEIYNIDNKSFFVFGGANSTDKEHRTEGKSWWKDEMPSSAERGYGLYNLNAHGNKVDYIITHTSYPSALIKVGGEYRIDELSDFFNQIKVTIDYKYWFFGHMHNDYRIIDDNTKCLYRDIEILE
jgi:DNA repair exonuclease SbcCD nuclease subunit